MTMKDFIKSTDTPSLAVIAVTFVLFVVALFVKGLTHDILLEAAVFLVSVKLIMGDYKIRQAAAKMQQTLDEIALALALEEKNRGEK